jgi:transcription elongation factor GreA
MDKIYLTPEGYNKLQAELQELKGPRRREVTQAIQVAREHGDLKENAEYDAAKEEQAKMEYRISQLQDQLASAVIIDPSHVPTDRISVGQRVRLRDLKSENEFDYILVSPAEADFEQGRISITSPVGKGLVGRKVGEEVEIKIPAGIQRFRVLEIGAA